MHSKGILWAVDAPHFYAGMIIGEEDLVIDAAPILDWTKGKKLSWLLTYFNKKGWTAMAIDKKQCLLCGLNVVREEIEQEEKETKVVDLQLIKGGKEPPTPPGSDWLTPMAEGTLFFVQSKLDPMDFSLGLFWKAAQDGKVIRLESPMLPNAIYVNPVRFCNKYLLYQDMGVKDYKKEEEENSHEQRDQVEKPGGVE